MVVGKSKAKKKRQYTADEKRAYWIGVGVSMATHGDRSCAMDGNTKMSKSARSGYEADNRKNKGVRLFGKRKGGKR